ncbi:MAG: hypothetical protein HY961_16305 [Ignavibacteriae bacterium]|nr:hypothetical protein [Ignavibacteriota bacterium]
MRNRRIHIALLTSLLLLGTAAEAGDPGGNEIGRTTEKELNVVISSSFGKVVVEKGEPQKIIVGEALDEESRALTMDYSIRNRVGFLDINLNPDKEPADHKNGSFHFGDLKNSKWLLRFTDAMPIAFDIELGVAQGEFDLTGLQVKDFNLSCGASNVVVSFDELNTESMNELNVQCGVGKFEGRHLGNANFKRFRFEGGVGTATLDFSGAINSEVDVDVNVGMGLCTIIVPKEVGARVFYDESLVSRLDVEKDIRAVDETSYVSDNFKSASGRMNIRVETGFGSVKIRRPK